jgi:hypothetical protein
MWAKVRMNERPISGEQTPVHLLDSGSVQQLRGPSLPGACHQDALSRT